MSTYGLVVDVAVTGTKKTIVVRSPVQVGEEGGREGEGRGREGGGEGGREGEVMFRLTGE